MVTPTLDYSSRVFDLLAIFFFSTVALVAFIYSVIFLQTDPNYQTIGTSTLLIAATGYYGLFMAFFYHYTTRVLTWTKGIYDKYPLFFYGLGIIIFLAIACFILSTVLGFQKMIEIAGGAVIMALIGALGYVAKKLIEPHLKKKPPSGGIKREKK